MAKYLTILLILALALASFFTFWFSKDSYKILPINQQPASEVAIEKYNFQNWHEFSAEDGAFNVMLPALPQHAKEVVNVTEKESRHYDMYVSEKGDGTVFMISSITFKGLPAGFDKREILRSMMDDMVASSPSNELRKEEEGEYKGHASLQYTIDNKDNAIDVKSFMDKDKMYVMTRVTKAVNYNTEEFNFFTNSFDLQAN